MHRCSRLATLSASSNKRLKRIAHRAQILSTNWRNLETRQLEAEIAFLCIDLLNTWTNASKYYLISALLGARLISGSQVRAGQASFFSNESDALGYIIQLFRPRAAPSSTGEWDRRDEPTWHEPRVFREVAKAAALSNMAEIDSAFSTGYRVFMDLPVFRNYFAHRNLETRRAAMNLGPSYGVGTTQKPSEVLRHTPPGESLSVLEAWVNDLAFTLEFLCT